MPNLVFVEYPFQVLKKGEMVKVSEIAFILRQKNELDASKNVLLKRVLNSSCYNV